MLRVRCSHSLGAFGAVGLLEDFAREHPGLSVEIQTSENLSPVVETGADLVLRVVQTPEPGVVAHKLGDCDSMYVASPAYASGLDILDPLQWSDIRLLPLEHETHWLVDGVTVPITARNAPVRYGTAWFAYRAALAGQGVARLPSMALREDLASGKLVALATAPSSGLSVWALLPSRRWIKPEIRLLLKRLEAHYGQPSNKRSDG